MCIHTDNAEASSAITVSCKSTPVGFEPTRGDHIGLAGRRLNRSAKVSTYIVRTFSLVSYSLRTTRLRGKRRGRRSRQGGRFFSDSRPSPDLALPCGSAPQWPCEPPGGAHGRPRWRPASQKPFARERVRDATHGGMRGQDTPGLPPVSGERPSQSSASLSPRPGKTAPYPRHLWDSNPRGETPSA